MKNLTVLTLLLISLLSIGQERFNNLYENNEYTNCRNVFALSDTAYVMLGATYTNNKIEVSVLATDSTGDFLWSKGYGDDIYNIYDGAENACIKTDGGYILSGASGQTNVGDTCFIYIVKFDEAFDTLWTRKHFVDTNWVTARGICNSIDGGYMVVGETELKSDSTLGDGHNYGLMIKLDANGNYEWFKSFGTDDNTDNLYKVVQTHDGGYLVGGGTDSWQGTLGYLDVGDWYVVKTDNLGNEEWHRRYGSPEYDDGRLMDILRASDSTYYILGAWTWDRNNTGSVKYKESYIVKLDQNFNEIYELKYDNQAFERSYPIDAIEIADSNIVLIGHKLTDNEAPRVTMHKITPNGEILWQREYVANHDTIDTQTYVSSIKQTLDSGFIFGGWASSSDLSPTQQMWLVKTDEYGCDGTGDFWDCATNIMHNEYVNNPSFEIYPNPARDNLQLTINNEQLDIEPVEMQIYDLTGKMVRQLTINNEQLTIDVSSFEKGVYIVRIGNETKKLVVK